MQSLSNFSRGEGVSVTRNDARTARVIRNTRGPEVTGLPTLTSLQIAVHWVYLDCAHPADPWRPFFSLILVNVPVRAPRRRRGRTGTF